eukprot:gnl/Dysnectes_brevis/2900_a3544_1379.p1 GENE.gnl/Dysnectes_brevis/2900_a3544_1379~~gnl/Dysnectes_brevis/2900_a3544_1379.p1  ORF type:complete len:194 (-),score=24.54 gnl/Dysnectes_brevis/2900_a3544_1379:67-648(-)
MSSLDDFLKTAESIGLKTKSCSFIPSHAVVPSIEHVHEMKSSFRAYIQAVSTFSDNILAQQPSLIHKDLQKESIIRATTQTAALTSQLTRICSQSRQLLYKLESSHTNSFPRVEKGQPEFVDGVVKMSHAADLLERFQSLAEWVNREHSPDADAAHHRAVSECLRGIEEGMRQLDVEASFFGKHLGETLIPEC